MTKKELMKLEDGTLLYNGRNEGTVRTAYGEKCIEILIPISSMWNDSNDYNDRPEWWEILED